MFKFKKEDLLEYASYEDVYTHVNHYDLFRHYVGDFKLGKPMLSPLAPEKKASFAIYAKGSTVLFNDFRLGGGDIVKFVMMRDSCSFREAINKIIHDAGLSDKFKSDHNYVAKPLIKYNKKIEYTKPNINVKRRKWEEYDIDFWKSYGIGKGTLKKYRVSPIKYIFFGRKIVVAEKYAYCFREKKDNIDTFTIYQPYSKENKWFKSHDASVFYGWSQLPEFGEELVITKSLKDVMTIDSITGIPSVALQSEKTKPKEHVIEELKQRYQKIYLLYDNDYDNINNNKPNYGREFGHEIATTFGLIQVEIPDCYSIKYDAKDLSDLAKNANISYVKEVLSNLNKYVI